MKEYFETKDGMKVYIHPTASHSHRPDLNNEVIGMVEIGERTFVRETVDLGRVIGVDHLVETSDKERIIFFQRGEQAYKSRMVLDREPVPTENVTCIVYKCGQEDGQEWDGKYVLISLYEGDPGMPEPYGRYEHDEECIDFWKTHALVPTPDEKEKILDEFNTFKDVLLFEREHLRKYGLEPNGSHLMPGFQNNNIEILYYGGTLACVSIDGEDIENILEIPEERGLDDALAYRITDEAIMFILQKLNER